MATAADVALLYQPLINSGKVWGGGQILKPETINNILTKQHTDERHYTVLAEEPRVTVPKRRGVVLELAADDTVTVPAEAAGAYAGKTLPAKIFRQGGFGYTNSPRAIGHDGAAGQIAWGDPESGLSFSWVTNTFTKAGQDQPRIVRLSTLAGAWAPKDYRKKRVWSDPAWSADDHPMRPNAENKAFWEHEAFGDGGLTRSACNKILCPGIGFNCGDVD